LTAGLTGYYYQENLINITQGAAMARPRVYIDGQEGTTGLRIREMLGPRHDLELLLVPAEQRKDPAVRADYLNRADLAILCLPDDAAGEAVAMVENPDTRLLDTSTPRRVDPAWVYGLPELCPEQRAALRGARRVAICGCYPVGFLLAVRPLVQAGLVPPETALTVNAVSGYSGGGRRMIEGYDQALRSARATDAAVPLCLYGLDGRHKHLPEMHRFSLLQRPPLFVPSVDHAFCGMLVSTPLPADRLARPGVTRQQVWEVWREYYRDEPFVRPVPPAEEAGQLRDGRFLDLGGCDETNRVDLFVFGDPDRGLVLVGRLDNLGKGASGNAVQCLNLMLGFPETAGLRA
jgi:N-acetyl-gamma-glutamyl-phosphate reductase